MAKRKKKGSKSAKSSSGIGKITVFYFNGDVGEFLDGLKKQLKKPGAIQEIAEVLAAAMPIVEAQQKKKEKADDAN